MALFLYEHLHMSKKNTIFAAAKVLSKKQNDIC